MSTFSGQAPVQIMRACSVEGCRGTYVSQQCQVYGEVGRVEKSSNNPEEIEAAVAAKVDTPHSSRAVAAFLLLSTILILGPIFCT